jgi:hypothetical protein
MVFSTVLASREAFPDYGKQPVNSCAYFVKRVWGWAFFAGWWGEHVRHPQHQSQVVFRDTKKQAHPLADFAAVIVDFLVFVSNDSSTSSASMMAMESNDLSNAVSSESSCALMMKEKSIRLLTTSRSAMVAPSKAL